MGLFGSYIRGEQTASSDIDVLVEFEKGHKDFFNYYFGIDIEAVWDTVRNNIPPFKKHIHTKSFRIRKSIKKRSKE